MGMSILSWVIIGLLAGALAKAIHPGKDPGGCFLTMVIGIAGGMIGGLIAALLGLGGLRGFSLWSLLLATLGAVLLLAILRMARK